MNLNSSEVEEPRACYTEWSKSERETQIQYINANVWNLGKYQWTHSQGRCRCREWTCGHSGESSININTLSGARRRAGEKMLCSTGSTIWWSVMTWRGGGRRGCKYNYGWFALLNGRNQHNIVNIKKKKIHWQMKTCTQRFTAAFMHGGPKVETAQRFINNLVYTGIHPYDRIKPINKKTQNTAQVKLKSIMPSKIM